ncbi:hypothetical protein Tco_1175426 [Tanacetum coccineum]
MMSRPRARIPFRPHLGVVAALVISISSDSLDKNMGSSISRVILFGFIPIEAPVVSADLPVAPKVGAATVASPAGVLERDTHSSLESGPSEGLLPPVPVAPMVSPCLCSDDFKSDTKLPERHVSSAPYDAMDIHVGQLYRTYPGGPCRALTTRKTVGPLPSHRLELRYTSHHIDRFTPGSSLDHSSSDHSSSDHSPGYHSSSRHSTSDQALYRHTSPITAIADSSTPSRFIYPPPTRTSRGSKAFRH